MTIQEYIDKLEEEGYSNKQMASTLQVSKSMVSSYKTQGYNPSIKVAKIVYRFDGTVLYPFSEEGVKDEL